MLNVFDKDVAVTGPYQGRRRMTLTYLAINRARHVLWVVTGAEKVQMLHRLLHCDADIPAGRVRCEKSLVLADAEAAGSPAAMKKRGALNSRGNINRSCRV